MKGGEVARRALGHDDFARLVFDEKKVDPLLELTFLEIGLHRFGIEPIDFLKPSFNHRPIEIQTFHARATFEERPSRSVILANAAAIFNRNGTKNSRFGERHLPLWSARLADFF